MIYQDIFTTARDATTKADLRHRGHGGDPEVTEQDHQFFRLGALDAPSVASVSKNVHELSQGLIPIALCFWTTGPVLVAVPSRGKV